MDPETIKRHRKALGYSQHELADALGVNRVSVARWETGVRRISTPAARLLMRLIEDLEEARRRRRSRRKKGDQ